MENVSTSFKLKLPRKSLDVANSKNGDVVLTSTENVEDVSLNIVKSEIVDDNVDIQNVTEDIKLEDQ